MDFSSPYVSTLDSRTNAFHSDGSVSLLLHTAAMQLLQAVATQCARRSEDHAMPVQNQSYDAIFFCHNAHDAPNERLLASTPTSRFPHR
jgi:hypothetical protein